MEETSTTNQVSAIASFMHASITALRGGVMCTESLVNGVIPDKTLKAKLIILYLWMNCPG